MTNTMGMADVPASKAADTSAELHEVIRNRWSPRAFAERDIQAEDLRRLLEAARWSASCFNEQPWRFVLARKADAAAYHKMLSVLSERNQKWARTAPLLMLTAGKRTFSHNGAPNRFALHDAGMALATLMVQATAMGLSVHAMGGFDQVRARAEFGIPDDYEVGAAVALGYLGDSSSLPEEFQENERATRKRKPLAEIAFQGAWGAGVQF